MSISSQGQSRPSLGGSSQAISASPLGSLPLDVAAQAIAAMPGSDAGSATVSEFAALGVAEPFLRALALEGYKQPTPIQRQSIPRILEGRDLLGYAQTGTGKTAAFVVPMLQRLAAQPSNGRIRALVLSPTRELASQIQERAEAYGRFVRLYSGVIFGGVNQRGQENMLRKGIDLLVATPGRLLDLLGQRVISLEAVETFVLDEADRMFDMGFADDVRRIVAQLVSRKQTLMFSATMPEPIELLARRLLRDPVKVQITPEKTSAETVTQHVFFVPQTHKRLLLQKLLREDGLSRTMVFTRTKHGANRLAEQLSRGGVQALAIHGNKSQNARERALLSFREGSTPVLVATDVAARGIDIDGVSHVVNYDLPEVPESYVHRIGRTGRAGATGVALAFCSPDERALLRDIERLLRTQVPVREANLSPEVLATITAEEPRAPRPDGRGGRGGRPQGRGFQGGGHGGGHGGGGGGGNSGQSRGGPRHSDGGNNGASQGGYSQGGPARAASPNVIVSRRPVAPFEGRPAENGSGGAPRTNGPSNSNGNLPSRGPRR